LNKLLPAKETNGLTLFTAHFKSPKGVTFSIDASRDKKSESA